MLPSIRFQSFAVLSALTFSIFSGVAHAAAVDFKDCPQVSGRYKQNGKEPVEISMGTVQTGAIAYQIGKQVYVVDREGHDLPNGDRYVGVCAEGTLGIKSYNPKNTAEQKTIKLQSFYGLHLLLETDEDQSIDDQALISLAAIRELPPHDASKCVSEFSSSIFSNHPDFLAVDDQPRSASITRISNGVELQIGSKSWKVDGAKHSGSEGEYQASCVNKALVINTRSNGKFVDSKVFLAAGSFKDNFLLYNFKTEGKFKAGAFFPAR